MHVSTIDDVILELEAILIWARESASRIGYFASLYLRVTLTIRDRIGTGFFADDQRMERLDIAFAGRYLKAVDQFRRRDPELLGAWQVAFDASRSDQLIIVQHLLVAMNPHINLDLADACAEIASRDELPELYGDFLKINQILASLVPAVIDEIDTLSPLIHLIDDLAQDDDEAIINFSMAEAREQAWQLARTLAALPPARRSEVMARRDAQIAALGRFILDPGPILRPLVEIVHLPECKQVVEIIDALDSSNPLLGHGREPHPPWEGSEEPPNKVYYFDIAAGFWTGRFHFRVTSWRLLWQAKIGLGNKLLVVAMQIWQWLFGDSSITSKIEPFPDRGQAGVAHNSFRIAKGRLTLFCSEEDYVLSPNGTGVLVDAQVRFGPIPFLFREHDVYPATIFDGGFRATYGIKLLGTRFLGTYQVRPDGRQVRSRLSNAFATAEETLSKETSTINPDATNAGVKLA